MATDRAINIERLRHAAALEQRLASIEAKVDQVLAALSMRAAPVQNEPARSGREGNRVKGT